MRKTGRCVFAAVLAAALLCTMPGMISCAEAGAISESSTEQGKAGATGQTEADTVESAKADTTKPAKADTAKPTETDAAKPVETDTTKPAKADEAKPTETDTAKPEEADTAKPAETDTAKPEETDKTKPAEDGVSPKTGADGNDTKAPAADGDEITKAELPASTSEENGENTERKNTGAEDADSNLGLIEELVADLPDHVTGDNAKAVRAKLDEILELYRELTEEQQEQIDISCCLKLQEELDAANAPALTQDIVTTELDFTNVGDGNGQTPAVGPGYKWSGDAGSGYLLELENFRMELSENTNMANGGPIAIAFPNKGQTTILVKGENSIKAPGWNAIRADVSNHTVGPYMDEDSILIKGEGESAALTIEDARTAIRASYALEIQNVSLRISAVKGGIYTYHDDINLKDVDMQIELSNSDIACINAFEGNAIIQNSKIQLKSSGLPPLFVRDGNLTVKDSELNISSDSISGIYIQNQSNIPGGSNIFSGKTAVSINCTSSYGIYSSKGDIVVEAPAKLTATGTSFAYAIFEGIVLRGTAVVNPVDGIITAPGGGSTVYTVRVGNTAAKSVEIKPVALTVSLDNTEYRYGSAAQATVTADAGITGTVSIYNGEELLGTADLGEVISIDTNNLGAGNHTLTAKLQENKGDVSKEFTLTVTKTVPTVTAPTATSIQYGQKLSESVLSGGTAADPGTGQSVEGTWAWKDGNILPGAGNSGYPAVFTPTDTEKYGTAELEVNLIVNKAQNAPNMPGSTMEAAADIEKVGDVSLPEGWEWQASDWNTLLEAGKPVSAVAVYTGTDKGNYETETVAVTITRMSGSQETEDPSHTGEDEKEPSHTGNPHRHSYTESVTRQPTCTDIGVRTYTCACGDSYTENIAALGHHYSGTVTKQPTTASEGIMTYICDRCGDRYTESIAKLQKENTVKTNNNRHSQPEDTEPESDSAEKTESPGDDGTGKAESEPGIPFIKDENGKIGWDVIRAEEEKAREGSVINVDMNGATVVPGNIFDSIKGKDITITFDMGDGIIWNVDGRSITRDSASGKAGDVDFGVETGVSAIPVDIVNNMTGESYSIQLSIAYEGEFGFTAVLLIDLGKENAGLTASLYYYNESTEELEFICADEVAQDGTASLAFTHASDYVIVVDGEAEENGVAAEDAKGQNRTDESAEDIPENSETGQTWWLWWIIVIILLAAIGSGVLLAVKKKREEEDGGE